MFMMWFHRAECLRLYEQEVVSIKTTEQAKEFDASYIRNSILNDPEPLTES